MTYHGKADVGLLQCRAVIRAVACYSHYLAVGVSFTVNNAFDKHVFVLW